MSLHWMDQCTLPRCILEDAVGGLGFYCCRSTQGQLAAYSSRVRTHMVDSGRLFLLLLLFFLTFFIRFLSSQRLQMLTLVLSWKYDSCLFGSSVALPTLCHRLSCTSPETITKPVFPSAKAFFLPQISDSMPLGKPKDSVKREP